MLNNLLKLWHAISGWWDAFTTWLHALIGDTAWLMLVSTCETLYMTLTATAFATRFYLMKAYRSASSSTPPAAAASSPTRWCTTRSASW